MRVFNLVSHFGKPETGGQLFHVNILNYLKRKEDIGIIMPTDTDLYFLNRPRGCLGINKYFFNRFRRLPQNTIVVETGHYFINFFIANWIIRLFRRDIHFLVSARQRPDPLLNGPMQIFRNIIAFLFFRSCHTITVNSQYLKNELSRVYSVARRRIHVVYSSGNTGGISHRRFTKDGEIRLLNVGHIRLLKGQRVLVEALNRLEGRRVKLDLVGGIKDEKYARELQDFIAELGLVEKVRLIGRLDGADLVRAYIKADIFVMPSLYEAYGVVAQEAMSFQLPIIASKVGGIPEQIRDGIEGLLVPPGNPDALSLALKKLIDNPDLRINMGKRGRSRVSELPTWDDVCERFYQVIIGISKSR